MTGSNSSNNQHPSISELYPCLDQEQLKEAEENLERYIELILRIHARLREDPDSYGKFRDLTGGKSENRISDTRSNPTS